jgi:hypothetical protein
MGSQSQAADPPPAGARLVQVGEMGHVRVLKRVLLLGRDFGRIAASLQQDDRQSVEVHGKRW